jgi:hypothetical protein
LTLPIPYLFWEAGPRAWIGVIPMLKAKVFASSRNQLVEKVKEDVKNALPHFQATSRLKYHWPFIWHKGLRLEINGERASIPSPREMDERRKCRDDEDSTLKTIRLHLIPISIASLVH